MKKIIYFLFVCVGAFYACKDEEQVLLNADFISDYCCPLKLKRA